MLRCANRLLLSLCPYLPHPSPPPKCREKLSSLAFNAAGDWIAVGSAKLGQLLVWEWRSETYVLKQQGHFYDVAASAFSPDGAYLATAADDAKVCSEGQSRSHTS